VDYEFYTAYGSSVDAVNTRVEAILNEVDYFYARDVLITHELAAIVVRTAPFYLTNDAGTLLNLFGNEWNANMGHIDRDLAHLMTGKNMGIYGGLAWVGTVCTSLQYAWSLDSSGIVGHEVGHNWGAGHCHDLTPCNNMCGGCMYIAPNTKDIITAFRDSRWCLDAVGPYSTPLPPYAHPEGFAVRKDEYSTLDGLHIDVLGNDHDGNCQQVRLEGHDGTTPRGATLSISAGTGPDGRDELVYDPPADPFLGDDVFHYVVGDGTGQQETGTITVTVRSLDLEGWWRLDDGSGTTALDESAHRRDGTASGNPVWTSGTHGGALELDGLDDLVSIPALDLDTDTLTITTWLERHGDQDGFAGIVFCRGGNTAAGLSFRGVNNELSYRWNGDPGGWTSGLVPPDGQWVFIALVVEPSQASIYMHDGATMQVATNPVGRGVEEFDAALMLGVDDGTVDHFAAVGLDDVRVYDFALSAAELDELIALGGRAQAPNPVDGGEVIGFGPSIEWKAGLFADSHDVYFGTGYDAVRLATTASGEFQGNQLDTTFLPGNLDYDTTYFWRIDEVVGGNVVEGHVWQLTAADFNHWRLDETSGTTAADDQLGVDGTYEGGVTLGEPGAAASTGTSVGFDGSDGRVKVPPLDLESNTLTISGWLRRDGDQISGAGVVFCEGASTDAGLTFRDATSLGYRWNEDPAASGWSSGLVVPDQTWVFFALVIEPTQATIHLGDAGVLSSATNAIHHAPEAFDAHLMLACRQEILARYFAGRLDDVRIHHAAMTPAQVDALYRSY